MHHFETKEDSKPSSEVPIQCQGTLANVTGSSTLPGSGFPPMVKQDPPKVTSSSEAQNQAIQDSNNKTADKQAPLGVATDLGYAPDKAPLNTNINTNIDVNKPVHGRRTVSR